VLDPYDELEFIHLLNLRNFRQFSAGYNFSCPICNEGKSRNKRRGFILVAGAKHDHNTYVCQNCLPEGISLKNFISEVDPYVAKKYAEREKQKYIEDIKSGKALKKKKRVINISYQEELSEKPQYVFKLNPNTFIPCSKVPLAIEYCKKRNIPRAVIEKLFYCKRTDLAYSDMIIFPLWFDEEKVYGFQGRSIKGKRFHTFMPNDNYKVYNLFGVDKSKDVFVFESIIDSLSVPNSIGMLGSDLSKPVKLLLKNRIFVFDNDRTGEEKTLKYISQGEKCFIWPPQLKSKDFGELVEKNIPQNLLTKIIEMRTFSGLKGEVEIKIKLSKSKKTFRRR